MKIFNFIHIEARIIRFTNIFQLTRKDLMVKNLKRFKRQIERENQKEAAKCDFFPTTFVLPVSSNNDICAFARQNFSISLLNFSLNITCLLKNSSANRAQFGL